MGRGNACFYSLAGRRRERAPITGPLQQKRARYKPGATASAGLIVSNVYGAPLAGTNM